MRPVCCSNAKAMLDRQEAEDALTLDRIQQPRLHNLRRFNPSTQRDRQKAMLMYPPSTASHYPRTKCTPSLRLLLKLLVQVLFTSLCAVADIGECGQ